MKYQNPVILIPAHRASRRLPNKALADLGGTPLVVRVWERCMEASCGPVAVATEDPDIARAVEGVGGMAILTKQTHVCGTDRMCEALNILDAGGHHRCVVNVQADMPFMSPHLVRRAIETLQDAFTDIATLAASAPDTILQNPNIVKVILSSEPGALRGRALYFTRAPAPWGEGSVYHHIGIYAFSRRALARFAARGPSPLEKREGLEQLRALEEGLRIEVGLVDTPPLGVDTPEQLLQARAQFVTPPEDKTDGR